jgi:hypothetical protein
MQLCRFICFFVSLACMPLYAMQEPNQLELLQQAYSPTTDPISEKSALLPAPKRKCNIIGRINLLKVPALHYQIKQAQEKGAPFYWFMGHTLPLNEEKYCYIHIKGESTYRCSRPGQYKNSSWYIVAPKQMINKDAELPIYECQHITYEDVLQKKFDGLNPAIRRWLLPQLQKMPLWHLSDFKRAIDSMNLSDDQKLWLAQHFHTNLGSIPCSPTGRVEDK